MRADAVVGGFQWTGAFAWIHTSESERSKLNPTEPIKTPTMAGGLLAINRQYFWDIGSYDKEMEGWGGENMEMSWRVNISLPFKVELQS